MHIIPLHRRYTDEYLNYWGEVYTSRPEIHDRGILFEAFLFAPLEFLKIAEKRQQKHIRQNSTLLPNQQAVQRVVDRLHRKTDHKRVESSEDEVALFRLSATNTGIERMRHHCYPRKKQPKLYTRILRKLRNWAGRTAA